VKSLLEGRSPHPLAAPVAGAENDPPRLLDSGSAHEQRLLASAQGDVVPATSASRVAAALGDVLIERGDSAAGSGGPATPRRSGLGAKPSAALGVMGVGVLALLAGTSIGLRPGGAEKAAPAPTERAAVVRSAVPSPAAPSSLSPAVTPLASAPAQPPPIVPAASPAPSIERARRHEASSATARRTPEPASRASSSGGTLLEEVRALDSVRRAIRAGDTQGAAQRLEDYRRRYPRGELQLESEVVAVDLALAEGRRESAAARARALLSRPGSQRYAEHLRRALEGSNTAAAHIEKQEPNHQ
jgi:hypothetical protein